MLYGVLAVLGSMGLVYLMIILSHCLVLYSIALAKQKWLCYVAGLCCLASFKVEPFSSWQVGAVSGHLSASFPAHLCPSPWVYLQGGLLGHPQTLLLAASELPQGLRGRDCCAADLGNNPTGAMSCFGSFMLGQSSGHPSLCCSGNSLSARKDAFPLRASVSPSVTRCWYGFSDAHAYLLGLCPVKTFSHWWVKPRKDLIKLFSPSEGQCCLSLPAAYLLKCVPLPPSGLGWLFVTPWGGLCPCDRVTFPPQTKPYVAHSCLVKIWPRGSTTSRLLWDAGASWEIEPQFSLSNSKAH